MPDLFEARETPEGWIVRNSTKGQTLHGIFSEGSAKRTAARLNANISLTPNQMSALKRIAVPEGATLAQVGLAYRSHSKNPFIGAESYGEKVCLQLEQYRLIEIDRDLKRARLSDWGRDWLGITT